MKRLLLTVLVLGVCSMYAQVGIGTVSPTAELEIEGTNTGIPVLELNPQSAPAGSATGQLAVIGDLLYMYDATRGKWLSTESTTLQFGSNGVRSNEYMGFGGDVRDSGSGARMPFNGTITAVTIVASGGLTTKGFEVHINGSVNTTYNLVGSEFTNSTVNIDFDAGDYLHMFISNTLGNVNDSAAIIWIKWRK